MRHLKDESVHYNRVIYTQKRRKDVHKANNYIVSMGRVEGKLHVFLTLNSNTLPAEQDSGNNEKNPSTY